MPRGRRPKYDAGTPKQNGGANLGFEEKLWQAADKLRGHMDAAEYKHVVLGLIFLKYISDAFDEHRRGLEGQLSFEGGPLYIQEPAARYEALEDRDLYVMILTAGADVLAHGSNPKLIGKNLMDVRDARGKAFIKPLIEAAQKAGSGWQDYEMPNPVTKEIEPRRMYWERHDGLIFTASIYKAS